MSRQPVASVASRRATSTVLTAARPWTRRAVLETDVPGPPGPAALGRFHWLVVAALGITWVLDGLEVTLAGAVSAALKESPALRLTDAQVGASASAYLAGAVLGALLFGWLTDLLGRRKLFFIHARPVPARQPAQRPSRRTSACSRCSAS